MVGLSGATQLVFFSIAITITSVAIVALVPLIVVTLGTLWCQHMWCQVVGPQEIDTIDIAVEVPIKSMGARSGNGHSTRSVARISRYYEGCPGDIRVSRRPRSSALGRCGSYRATYTG